MTGWSEPGFSILVPETALPPVRRLRRMEPGASALVAGHSNTVPELLTALGVKETVTIADDEYDNLFVVTLDSAGRTWLKRLRFGDQR